MHGARAPGNCADPFGLGARQSQSEGGRAGRAAGLRSPRARPGGWRPGGRGRWLLRQGEGGGNRAHAGAGPRWKGRGLRGRAAAQGGLWRPSVTHAAAREAAAEAAAAVAAGAAGTGRGARAPPGGRGPPPSVARLLSDPRRGRACPGVLEKPAGSRGWHGAGARSAGGRARCGRERRGAPGLPLFEAGGPMRRAREGREIRSSGGARRGRRAVRRRQQRPEPGGGPQEAAAART